MQNSSSPRLAPLPTGRNSPFSHLFITHSTTTPCATPYYASQIVTQASFDSCVIPNLRPNLSAGTQPMSLPQSHRQQPREALTSSSLESGRGAGGRRFAWHCQPAAELLTAHAEARIASVLFGRIATTEHEYLAPRWVVQTATGILLPRQSKH